MNDFHQNANDFILGMTAGAITCKKAGERQAKTIESVLRTELVAIWRRDELPLETVLEKIEEMEINGWESTLEWLGHFYLFESYRYMWDMTFAEEDLNTHDDDFVLGMKIDDELMVEKAHDRHEKTLRSLLTFHAVAGWKCGNYKLEKTLEMIEDMDDFGALGAWNCSAAEAELDRV